MENICYLLRKISFYSFYIIIKGESIGVNVFLDNNIKFFIKIFKCIKFLLDNNLDKIK